jgi:hypothetical protein
MALSTRQIQLLAGKVAEVFPPRGSRFAYFAQRSRETR